jgi:hypothetical protein
VVRQQPRHALHKARMVIDHDHDCRLRHHICVQPLGRKWRPKVSANR